MFHCHENGVKTLNVEEGFLLLSKRSVRHIFCSSGGTHRKRGVFVIGGKLCIGFADGVFQLRLEGSVDNPLADLRARFRKLSNIVNIRFIQQFINALVYAALVQKLVKRVGGCGETIRTETPIPERLVIISPGEAFLPPTLSTSFMPSWLYQSTSGDEPLLDIEQSFCDK